MLYVSRRVRQECNVLKKATCSSVLFCQSHLLPCMWVAILFRASGSQTHALCLRFRHTHVRPALCSLPPIVVAGAQNSPPISDPTVGQAFLAISFNTDSNNITYQLFADNITEVMAAHIHISATVGANGSVSIPLYQAPFVGLPGSTSTGLLAASALMPAVFVGPYLEILPDYTNVNVSAVLTQYVQTGLAYAQVCLGLC